jgi:hypothetical protein
MSQLRVNLSSQEAESTSLDVLPSGKYLCNIVEGSVEEVKPGRKNVGKPYWKLRFVVQEGKYAGRNIYSTVMLFETALYSLSQILKALGYDVAAGEITVPDVGELEGKTLIVRGQKKPASTDPESGRDIPERFEVKGYQAANVTAKTGDSSILP